jgi:hypothetical protein
MSDDIIQIHPPLYMIGKKIRCWRCESVLPVIALLAPKIVDTEEQVCVLTGITTIPDEVLKFIQSKVPTFKMRHSRKAGKTYYANTCPKCGVIYGDFFLQDEPGAPFFPEDEEAAKFLYIKEIPINGPIKMSAGLGFGLGETILANAKRV